MKKSELRELIREELSNVLSEARGWRGDVMSLETLKELMETHAKNILMYQSWLKENPTPEEAKIIRQIMQVDKNSYDAVVKLYNMKKKQQ